jgi:NADH-quinone oxidoreductase subunit D
MFPSYLRIGGLREELPQGFHEAAGELIERMPAKIDQYEDLLTKNEIWVRRTQGVGAISRAEAYAWGLVGPIARASGSTYDVRKAFPYCGYETFEFDVPVGTAGDVFDRYLVRLGELRQSVRIARQALARIDRHGAWSCGDSRVVPPPKDKVYTEMEALIQHFLIHSQGFVVPAGEAYVPVEGPRGEHGCYVVSDGSNRPWRVKMRSPSLMACQALPKMIVGGMIADVIAVIGSIDVVMGDVDR